MHAKVYVYGLQAPTLNADVVADQMWRAHQYYNTLVEIERERRDAIRKVLGNTSAEVETLEAQRQAISSAIVETREAIKRLRAVTRKRSDTAEMRAKVRELTSQEREARKAVREARRRDRETGVSSVDKAYLKTTEESTIAKVKAAQAASGLYWGTYNLVKQARDASRKALEGLWVFDAGVGGHVPHDPSFRRWKGEGAVAVQIQYPKGTEPFTYEKLLAATDSRLQLVLLSPHAAPNRNSKHRDTRRFGTFRMRVLSDAERQPVWAEWPIVVHRPLPEKAKINHATVKHYKVADRSKWELHLGVDVPESTEKECGHGAIAVDVGWRKMGEETRMAYCVDDAGRTYDVMLDPEVPRRLAKVESLQEDRQRCQNVLQIKLEVAVAKLLQDPSLKEETAWLADATTHLKLWKAPRRFVNLRNAWKGNRFAGDTMAFDLLETWYHRDRHLWQWMEFQRRKAYKRREDQQKRLACEFSKRYDTLVLEDFDKRETQKAGATESEKVTSPKVRKQQNSVATSSLCHFLTCAFGTRGGTIWKVDPSMTTQKCHLCGFTGRWDAAKSVTHTCEGCGQTWDQDFNGATNILGVFLSQGGTQVSVAKKEGGAWKRRKSEKAEKASI